MRIIEGKHRGHIKGQRAKPIPGAPPHCPHVDVVNLRVALREMPQDHRARIEQLLNDMKRTAEDMQEKIDLSLPSHKKTSINRKVLRAMLNSKVITKSSAKEPNCIVFLVPEIHKGRNRIICWPIIANATGMYEWNHDLAEQSDLVDITRDVMESNSTFGAACDIKASFYQIPLEDETLRRMFVFAYKGKLYEWTRLPMGVSYAPEIMQLVTQAVAMLAVQAVGAQGCRFKVHVDNIFFYGPKHSGSSTSRNKEGGRKVESHVWRLARAGTSEGGVSRCGF